MQRQKLNFLFLNIGHFLDHFFMLIFASVVALHLTAKWQMSYAELIPLATPGFIAFGLGALAAGWLADKWSREGMMVIFFFGIGLSSVLAGSATSPFYMSFCLTLIGLFAAIYHPVGLAMVVQGRSKTGIALAVNGVFGNLGVASAALFTGFLIDTLGWQAAFYLPGVLSIIIGFAYLIFLRQKSTAPAAESGDRANTKPAAAQPANSVSPQTLKRVFAVIFFSTALGGLIFQSTTFALPEILDERLYELADSATLVGWYTFWVFALAAVAQLLVGYLVDRLSIRLVFAVVAILQAMFFFIMTHLNGVAALIVAFGFMFVVFGQIPINDVLVGQMAKSEWRSRAYAARYIVTFSVMAAALPVISWVHHNWGFEKLFTILAIAALLIFAAVLTLPETRGESTWNSACSQ